jgi:hypothetical protein
MKLFKNNVADKWWYALIILSCLHLFSINVKDSHDWGDDFAQYIHQAKNITKGVSQSETGYIFNKNLPLSGPPAYSMGFPLLLAPVYALAGNSIISFSYLISTFFLLCALIFFRFFRKYLSAFSSYLLVLIFVSNTWMLDFKMEIVSDIPFTFFLFLAVVLYSDLKKPVYSFILLGLISGFLISIRSLGTAFIIAVVIHELLAYKKEKGTTGRQRLAYAALLFPLISAGVFVFINYILFDIPRGHFEESSRFFTNENIYDKILVNINYYFDVFLNLFNTVPENRYALFSTLIKSGMFSLMLLGFFIRIKKRISFIEIFLIIYMIVLYTYPYSYSGYRFLIPVTPIFLLYAAEALRFLQHSLSWNKKIIYTLAIVSFYLAYKYDWQIILNDQNTVLQGPQRLDSRAAFEHIKASTSKDARILFRKPRALALYTNRNCFENKPDESFVNLQNQLLEYNIDYILINEEISDDTIKSFVAKNTGNVQLVWNNSTFTFYKVLKRQ